MRIRLMGTRDEINAVLPAVQAALDVQEISDFYPNRGNSQLGRVYVEIAVERHTGEFGQSRSQHRDGADGEL